MSAKSVAVKLLARREHSALEIRQKLLKRDFDETEISLAIVELQEGDWLSDKRFTEAYIRMRQQKGFGPIRIAMELSERGVEDAIVESYLLPADDKWLQSLKQQYLKKYKSKPVTDYSDQAKRIRFLQYRGFSLDAIIHVVKNES